MDWSSDVCSSDLRLGAYRPNPQSSATVIPAAAAWRGATRHTDPDAADRPGGRVDVRLDSPRDGVRGTVADRYHVRDRKRVVEGKSVSVRVDLGGRRRLKKKTKIIINRNNS